MRSFATVACLLLARPAIAQTQAGTNAAIAAVKTVYQQVEAAVNASRLVRHDTTVTCGPQDLDGNFTIWRDSAGTVRRLDARYGTDDMASVEHYYYDGQGRLRFIFARYGHIPDMHMDERVYYDENRHELRRLRERQSGRSFPFEHATPLWNPASWYKEFCSAK